MAVHKKTATKRTTKKTTTKKASDKKPAAKPAAKKKLSQLGAAVKILQAAKEPMNCKDIVEAMAKKNLWKSPGGKTPEATLYAAIVREINQKSEDARFKKVDRGLFALT